MVYVLMEKGVAEINGTNNNVVGVLPLVLGAGSLAYDSSTHVIYGSSLGDDMLVGADVRTGAVVMNVSLGYLADSVAVDQQSNLVYAVGCDGGGLVCNSTMSIASGTGHKVISQLTFGSGVYPRVTVDETRNTVYVSGEDQLVAVNGTDGKVIYNSNSLACGAIDSMAVTTSSHQVLAVSLDHNYLLEYDGVSGELVNMYPFSSAPQYVAFNSNANESYVTLFSGQLVAFRNVTSTGLVNSALVGSGQYCALP